MPCTSITFDPSVGPLIPLGFALPNSFYAARSGGDAPAIHEFVALIDTGASVTCISSEIVSAVALPLIGKTQMESANAVQIANVYMTDIALRFGDPTTDLGQTQALVIENHQVMEFKANNRPYTVLLGRDILCQGYFNIAGYDKRFTLCM